MLRIRREHTDGLPDDVEILHSAPGTLALRRGDLVAVVNCGSRLRALPPEAGDLLISSADPPRRRSDRTRHGGVVPRKLIARRIKTAPRRS